MTLFCLSRMLAPNRDSWLMSVNGSSMRDPIPQCGKGHGRSPIRALTSVKDRAGQ
jgi:hypothetical protein